MRELAGRVKENEARADEENFWWLSPSCILYSFFRTAKKQKKKKTEKSGSKLIKIPPLLNAG